MPEDGTRIPPLHNNMFLRVFGSQGSAPITLPLVNSILDAVGIPPLERVDSIAADAASPGGAVLKSSRFDVILRCDGRVIDVEAERRRVDVEAKSLFYASRLICEGTERGTNADYGELPRVVVITLLDVEGELFEGDQLLTVGGVCWRAGGALRPSRDPHATFVVAEMSKVRARYNELTEDVLADRCLAWLYLLASGYRDPGEVKRMADDAKIEGIEDFAREYGIALDDPTLKHEFDMWLEATMEWNSMNTVARREAREQGYKEGYDLGYDSGRAEGYDSGYDSGRAEGYDSGLEAGKSEGFENGRQSLAAKLESLGVDSALIQQALGK